MKFLLLLLKFSLIFYFGIQHNLNANLFSIVMIFFPRFWNYLPKDLLIMWKFSGSTMESENHEKAMTGFDVLELLGAIFGKLQFKFAHRA